ncbi:hypothetical protein KHP62_03645 [Rhodobacteraceae bacterium NNCM2]|nr:hypothetical protein [Coraliihabitans acroporae]
MPVVAEARSGWAGSRESGTRWQLRLMRALALRAPGIVVDPLIWAISLSYALNRRRPATRGSILYLRRVLGREPTLGERHRHARTFAHVFLDRVRFLAGGVDGFRITAEGGELIGDLHAAGKGAVLLGAHFGSFEALRAYDRALPGLTIRYLMFPGHAPNSTALLDEVNPAVAANVIRLDDGFAAMIEVYEALDRGEFVAFLGDRMPNPDVRSKVTVPFLGGEIDLPTSPYIAAMSAKVPVILCVAPRLGKDRYAIEFSMFHDGAPVPRAGRQARIDALARRYAATLEALCRRHPYNWFNFFDIWRG